MGEDSAAKDQRHMRYMQLYCTEIYNASVTLLCLFDEDVRPSIGKNIYSIIKSSLRVSMSS